MIKPGINENVLISKVEMTDKDRLAITFKEVGAVTATGEEMSDFEELAGEGAATESAGFDVSIQLFPFNTAKKDGTEFTVKQIGEDIKRLKNLFLHLLSAYQPVQHVKFPSIYEGTGIKDSATYEKGIRQESILKTIFKNLCKDFLLLIEPHVAAAKPVRILFLRRSKDVHYCTFRTKFLSDNPMIESMDIPADQSKLGFTAWEIKEGLDKSEQITASSADTPGAEGGNTSVPNMPDMPDMPDDLPFGDIQ